MRLEARSRLLPSVTFESDCTVCHLDVILCMIFDNDILYYQLLAKYSIGLCSFKHLSTFMPYLRILILSIETFMKIIKLSVVC